MRRRARRDRGARPRASRDVRRTRRRCPWRARSPCRRRRRLACARPRGSDRTRHAALRCASGSPGVARFHSTSLIATTPFQPSSSPSATYSSRQGSSPRSATSSSARQRLVALAHLLVEDLGAAAGHAADLFLVALDLHQLGQVIGDARPVLELFAELGQTLDGAEVLGVEAAHDVEHAHRVLRIVERPLVEIGELVRDLELDRVAPRSPSADARAQTRPVPRLIGALVELGDLARGPRRGSRRDRRARARSARWPLRDRRARPA